MTKSSVIVIGAGLGGLSTGINAQRNGYQWRIFEHARHPGGVLMNILNYAQHGLRDYSSFAIWLIAVEINNYGTIWNIVATLGMFKRVDKLKAKGDGNQP